LPRDISFLARNIFHFLPELFFIVYQGIFHYLPGGISFLAQAIINYTLY
jgi:hypothetical protein